MKDKNKKPYILFSKNGEYFFDTFDEATEAKKVHGGYISEERLYRDQYIFMGFTNWEFQRKEFTKY